MAVFLYWFIRPFCKHFSEIVSVYLFLVDSKLIKSKFTSNLKTFFFALRWLWKMYMLPQKQQVLMVAQSLLIERSSFWVAKNKWNFWACIIKTFLGEAKNSLIFVLFNETKTTKQKFSLAWYRLLQEKETYYYFFFVKSKTFDQKKNKKKKLPGFSISMV